MNNSPQFLIQGWRIKAVLTVFVFGALYISVHLFKLQIIDNTVMADKLAQLVDKRETIPAVRGLIRDSKGYLLAGNTQAYDLYVDKSNIQDDNDLLEMASLLGPTLGKAPEDIYSRMTMTYTNILLQPRLDKDTAARIRQLVKDQKDVFGVHITLDPQPARAYPNGAFASHVLGYTDYDGAGQYGVEQFYNDALAGEDGWVSAERDANNIPLPMDEPQRKDAIDGADIQLTIDSAVQDMAEREIDFTVADTKADSGMIMVMDPHTGAIVALAIAPRYDPNHFTQITDWGILKNTAVSSVFEPGSTFKTITFGSSIDGGAVSPDTTFNCQGTIYVYGWPISNSTQTAHGIESMKQGMSRSCNIAADFAATQLGETRFYQYLKNFGFGQLTGIDMAGEIPGTLWLPSDIGPGEYSPINLYTNAFGQAMAVTPVQLLTGIAALINGGNLMKPHVVSQVTRAGVVEQDNKPTVVRRVISPDASQAIKDMMVWAVENTGDNPAKVAGYHIGAKTGTAQVPDPDGGYQSDNTIGSVVGFAPQADPRFIVLVRLDHPRSSQWGGETASPSFARLAKQLLQYYKVPPDAADN